MTVKKPRDRYISIGNINTHYWDEGDSESVIVLVHGINASVAFWENNIFEFAKKHRVIAVDLVGFGDTDKPSLSYDINVLAQFLKSFLDALKIKKCCLAGHSLGGAVCVQFTLSFPSVVEKLVLVSSVGFDRKLPLPLRLLTLPTVGKALVRLTKKVVAKAIRLYTYNKACISDEFIENIRRINQLPGAQHTLISLLQNNANFGGIRKRVLNPIMQQLEKLTIPVLIIWGREDKLLSVKGAYKAVQLIPGAELYIFAKCGHIPQMEHTDKFNQLVEEFFDA
jgi:pimeloyl-ACP methyl ester carboxylesterase